MRSCQRRPPARSVGDDRYLFEPYARAAMSSSSTSSAWSTECGSSTSPTVPDSRRSTPSSGSATCSLSPSPANGAFDVATSSTASGRVARPRSRRPDASSGPAAASA